MSAWTKQEEADLTAWVRDDRSWARIAVAMAPRSKLACQSKARQLRVGRSQLGGECASDKREYTGEHGRPRFKAPRVKLALRLDRAVRGRFVAVARALGLRPGVLMLQSLERVGRKCTEIYLEPVQWDALTALLGAPPNLTELTASEVQVQDTTGDRVAVAWCVPEQAVIDAAARTGESQYATAERAVIEALQEYGYEISSS